MFGVVGGFIGAGVFAMVMDEADNSLVRVVVWVRDASWRRAARGLGLRTVEVESGYEALAEMLTATAAVLVVELSLLSPRHVRLVEAARQRGVDVLGLGGLHPNVSVAALSGVRLVSSDDLAAAVERLAAAAASEHTATAIDPGIFVAEEDVPAAESDGEGVEVDEELAAAIEAERMAAVQGWGDISAAPVTAPSATPIVPSAMAVPLASDSSATGNGSGNGQAYVRDAGSPPATKQSEDGTPAQGDEAGAASSNGLANGTPSAGGTPAPHETPATQSAAQDDLPPRGLLTRDELSALLEDSR